ncbi:MAG: hypothetical protein AAGK22_15150 [Acidobacteriota bacterium]
MSDDRKDMRERLLAHFEGTLSEDDRETLERSALQDDGSFEALEAIETELVEDYIRGELNARDEGIVAAAIQRSPRLSESAELVAALDAREQLATLSGRREREASGRGSGARRLWGLLLLAALALLHLSQRAELKRLESEARELRQQLDASQAERLRLERELARSEAELRTRRQASESGRG